MKLPSFQFYPGDWRKDGGVQALSFHDRGVWFEMLVLMHESSERGKLLLNGRPMPTEALARILGLDIQNLTTTITTLLTFGVASTDEETGALMSRRMVRDEEIRRTRAECGKLGGNPALLNQNSTTGVKVLPTPSSSSSSSFSTSSSENKELFCSSGDERPGQPLTQLNPIRRDFVEFWSVVWKKTGIDAAFKAYEKRRKQGIPHEMMRDAAKVQAPYLLMNDRPIHPATWLNQGRYLDEADAYKPRDGPRKPVAAPGDFLRRRLAELEKKEATQ